MVGVAVASVLAWRRRAVLALGARRARAGLGRDRLAGASERADASSTTPRRGSTGRRAGGSSSSPTACGSPPTTRSWASGWAASSEAYADRPASAGEDRRSAASHNTPVTVASETGITGPRAAGVAVAAGLLPRSGAAGRGRGPRRLASAWRLRAIAVHSLFYAAFFEDPMTWGLLGPRRGRRDSWREEAPA